MMNENEQVPQIPIDVLVARHQEDQNTVTDEDVLHIAGLFKQVGNELHTVDHNALGGNAKALQLDQQRVFNTTGTIKAPVAPEEAINPVQQLQPSPEINPPRTPAVPIAPVQPSIINSDIEIRVDTLERKFNKIIRPPHKKVNVKFKSEHITAVFDDFEDIVDAIRKSLNKSSKRITITLNEN